MGFTSAFTAGLAQLLEDEGAGTWRPDGTAYTSGEWAIVPGTVPASPDRLITLTLYDGADDPTQAESFPRVQVRTRGDRDIRTSEDKQDEVFDVLQNIPRRTVGGIVVAGCWRRSGPAYIGVDENGRHQHSSNYEFRLHSPSRFRS